MTLLFADPNADQRDGGDAVVGPYFHNAQGIDLRAHELGTASNVVRRRVPGDGFALETLIVDGDVELRGDDPLRVLVIWIVAGRVESRIRGAVATAGPGDLVVGSTGTAPFRVRLRDAEVKVVMLDRALLERVTADYVPPSTESERPSPYLGDLVPLGSGAVRQWIRTHDYVAETMNGTGLASPLVLAECGRLLATTALAVFGARRARSAGEHRAKDDGAPAHPVMLRRAMAFLEAHARSDVGVNDVAAALYLTPRALQYMFRKHLDVTPMAYLRRIRLEHVHAELLRGDRRTTTVSTAAARWGFAHTGRFAVLYRETYGRSPHVTLRD